ncbi:hypothetical protein DRF65_20650 [Chryseobacterium pennae]|uniref:Uncharacterized protein n=1 Tax=Chryseobacterium pennae TaxID=2258962 RepID=A0A3D9C4I9_9FLAO|nr:hypothetical protein [Chryseobacterium pennae]REC60476.1 hypothetical protein DRF65_20650 [Chryseobacterium pennae]
MRKINNEVAQILKEFIKIELNEYKHILVDECFQLTPGKYFLKLTVVYEYYSSRILKENKDIEGTKVVIDYIPKISILKNLNTKKGYLFNQFPHSTIIRDENRFLVNLKSSIIFFTEKHKSIINKREIDELRWIISNYIAGIKDYDSDYLRYKIYEGLINLYNYFTPNDFISLSTLPVLFSYHHSHPYVKEIMNNHLASLDFEQRMIEVLNQYGGFVNSIDSKNSFYSNEVILVFKYSDLDLDSFLENIFFKFFTITRNVNYRLNSFYWEKNIEGFFTLYLNANKELIEREILPEIEIKLNSNVHVKEISDISMVYDLFQDDYYLGLNRLCEYVLELKSNESLIWNQNIAISYCIELYVNCIIRLNFSKRNFLDFNKYLSQKWQLFLLSDQELISNEYATISEMYQKFERLYLVNESSLNENFCSKIDNWIPSDSFLEEINVIAESMDNFLQKKENMFISNAILSSFSDNTKYAFLEGFLFKFFGLMGLETESKIYITYIINRLSNETEFN